MRFCFTPIEHNWRTCSIFRVWGSHTGGYEKFCLLKYNALWSTENQQTFRKNMSKNKPSKKISVKAGSKRNQSYFNACFFLGLFFDTEDGGHMFLRNIGWLSTDHTAFYHRR
jgi:hypothetical protein